MSATCSGSVRDERRKSANPPPSPGEIIIVIAQPVHPHLFRHQRLTYLTARGVSDSQIPLLSGHESKKSLEVYQHLSLENVEQAYQEAVKVLEV
jgi:integrase